MKASDVKIILTTIVRHYPNFKVDSMTIDTWLESLADVELIDALAVLDNWHGQKPPTPKWVKEHSVFKKIERDKFAEFMNWTDGMELPKGNDALSRLIRRLATGSEDDTEPEQVEEIVDYEMKYPNELQCQFLATHDGFYWDYKQGIIKDKLRKYEDEKDGKKKTV